MSSRLTAAILTLGCAAAVGIFFLTVQSTTKPFCEGFCGTAQVSVSGVECAEVRGNLVCTVQALNTGTASVAVIDCAITYETPQTRNTVHCEISGSSTLAAGDGPQSVICTVDNFSLPAGASFTGVLYLDNGSSASFYGSAPGG
ncbi:MAG: hypothetical protein HY296_00630 [Thaumarchaeota archaeon]|nr:hypothetical protein [Nitrososphaerota archaeon]